MCENQCVNGIVPCWNPGGPCPEEQSVCENCGVCQLCKEKNRGR